MENFKKNIPSSLKNQSLLENKISQEIHGKTVKKNNSNEENQP